MKITFGKAWENDFNSNEIPTDELVERVKQSKEDV